MELTSRDLLCKTSFVIDHAIAKTSTIKPILISGFWRSGTTWVQEALASGIRAKTLFEPLEPSALLPLHRSFGQEFGSYIPITSAVFSNEDLAFLDKSFKGISARRSKFPYLCRNHLNEAFRKTVVVKLVRGQFLTDYFSERYQLGTVIHISRHPMAVISSMLRAKWAWDIADIDFNHTYFREQSIKLSKNQKSVLDTLIRFSNSEPEVKLAALWALCEKSAHEQSNHVFFQYEDLLQNPDVEFRKMARYVGEDIIETPNYGKATIVSEKDRKDIDETTRIHSWKSTLTQTQIQNIYTTLVDIWPEVSEKWDLKGIE